MKPVSPDAEDEQHILLRNDELIPPAMPTQVYNGPHLQPDWIPLNDSFFINRSSSHYDKPGTAFCYCLIMINIFFTHQTVDMGWIGYGGNVTNPVGNENFADQDGFKKAMELFHN